MSTEPHRRGIIVTAITDEIQSRRQSKRSGGALAESEGSQKWTVLLHIKSKNSYCTATNYAQFLKFCIHI